MKRIGILLFFLTACTVMAQNKWSPYSRHCLVRMEDENRTARTAHSDAVRAYLQLRAAGDTAALVAIGVRVQTCAGTWVTADIPAGRLAALGELDGVLYVQLAHPVGGQLDRARAATRGDEVLAGGAGRAARDGRGVIVGVIDAGFDYTHPAFRDSAGDVRIRRVWEQNYDGGTPPAGFSYGSEFATPTEILSAGGDVTTNSHGTHVAAIAAGSERTADNPYYGFAPGAEIVLVSLGSDAPADVAVTDGISYIHKYADAAGMPCVINMSLGTQVGPHDGTSAFDRMADALAGEGRLIVGSSGNFGHRPIHLSHTFAGGDTLRTFLDFSSNTNTTGDIDLWADAGVELDLRVVIVGTTRGAVVDSSEVIDVAATEGGTYEYIPEKSASGRVLISTEINPANGKPHALISVDMQSLRMNHTVGLLVTPRTVGSVHLWADEGYDGFTGNNLAGWSDGDTECTIAEIGGTARSVISVGAYVSRRAYTTEGSTVEQHTDETLHALATFSGRGPTVDGRMKPDITAPGTYVASAISSHDTGAAAYPVARTTTADGCEYRYAYMQGTSMAAPAVAGILATWLEADPTLTPDAVRELIAATALRDDRTDGASTVASPWGYGKIDACAGLERLLSADGISSTVIDRPAAPTAAIGIYNLAGQKLTHSIDRLPAGIYIIRDADGVRKVIR